MQQTFYASEIASEIVDNLTNVESSITLSDVCVCVLLCVYIHVHVLVHASAGSDERKHKTFSKTRPLRSPSTCLRFPASMITGAHLPASPHTHSRSKPVKPRPNIHPACVRVHTCMHASEAHVLHACMHRLHILTRTRARAHASAHAHANAHAHTAHAYTCMWTGCAAILIDRYK